MAAGSVLSLLLGVGAFYTRKAEITNEGEKKLLKIYESLDISDTLKDQMAADTQQEQSQWEASWKAEQNVASHLTPPHYALTIALGYFAGLLLVLSNSYVFSNFFSDPSFAFIVFPLAVLAIAGYLKNKISDQNAWIGLLKGLVTGALAATTTWLIAGLF